MSLHLSTFWLIAFAMVLLAIVFIVVPFVRFENKQSHKGLKSQWYLSRLKELELEFERGQFTQSQFDAAVTELKQTATDELLHEQSEVTNVSNKLSRPWILSLVVGFVLVSSLAYWQFGHFTKLQDWQDTLHQMPQLSKKVIEGSDTAPTTKELQDFSLALRTRLAKEPNAIGWMLLGRNMMMLNDIDGAIDAFDKSFLLDDKSVSTILSLAQSLQQRGEPGDYSRSIRILRHALNLNPQNLTALILLAEGQLMNEQYQESLTGFRLSQRFIAQDDPRRGAIIQRIAFLESKIGAPGVDGNIDVTSTAANSDAASVENQDENPDANQGQQIHAEIHVAQNVNLDGYQALFVFAKKPGQPMPLAVKKVMLNDSMKTQWAALQAQEKPLVVTLSEQDVMIASMSLSNQKEVDIFVTLSKDTNAPLENGDIQAVQKNVALPSQAPIKLNLSKDAS
jgi:cytochrome c-type biogenesis protein CcmH